MKMPFHRVPIGSQFTFQGETFKKLGLSMAEDANRNGHIMQYDYEVEEDEMNLDPQIGFPKWEGFEDRQRMRCGKGQNPITSPTIADKIRLAAGSVRTKARGDFDTRGNAFSWCSASFFAESAIVMPTKTKRQ